MTAPRARWDGGRGAPLRRLLGLLASLGLAVAGAGGSPGAESGDEGGVLAWSDDLPPLPDAHGFAGAFAGVSGGALLVAGGANFPEGFPWDGGAKVWHDRIFVLEAGAAGWRELDERLPRPLGYGVSVPLPERDSTLWIGGNDGNGAGSSSAAVLEVRWRDGRIDLVERPPLPVPAAMACGALVGGAVFVAGGTDDGERAWARCFRLATGGDPAAWSWDEIPWPEEAPGRILAVAGSQAGEFFLISGCGLGADTWDGRRYLSDAWAWSPAAGRWRRLADVPRAVAAAPTPAIPAGQAHLLVLGGSNREFVDAQRALRPETDGNGTAHPGFPAEILAYHTITDTWASRGAVPVDVRADHETDPEASRWAPVTAPVVPWDGRWVVVSGEIKPGIRTPRLLAAELVPARLPFGALNWSVVGLYLAGMVGIGAWFAKREKTTDDYFRGGQRLPWWAAGLSIFATMLSAITFMAIPARAYATDASWYIGQLPILLVVPLVAMCYLPFFRRLDVTSAYEYLEQRFGLASRLFASVSFMLFHVGRIAIVLYLPALALSQVTAVDVTLCILVLGVLCIVYTVLGGIEAVVWTDAVQAVVLMGGALLCFLLVAARIDGGFGGIWATAVADEKLFQSLTADVGVLDGTTSVWVLFVAFFFNALVPYTSGQDVVQRYVTTPSEAMARRSLWTTMWMSVFGSMVFFGLGVALYAFYQASPGRLDPGMVKTDAILPFFILQQLPAGVAGLVIAAVFAAAQSTVSSSLNSVATAWVTDIHKRLLRPGNPDARNLRVARAAVVVVGAAGTGAACLLASADIESAFKTFNQLIGLTAGSLGGLFALGVFTRCRGDRAALTGALAGVAVVVAMAVGNCPVTGLLYAAISFTVCLVVACLADRIAGGAADVPRGLSLRGARPPRTPSPGDAPAR